MFHEIAIQVFVYNWLKFIFQKTFLIKRVLQEWAGKAEITVVNCSGPFWLKLHISSETLDAGAFFEGLVAPVPLSLGVLRLDAVWQEFALLWWPDLAQIEAACLFQTLINLHQLMPLQVVYKWTNLTFKQFSNLLLPFCLFFLILWFNFGKELGLHTYEALIHLDFHLLAEIWVEICKGLFAVFHIFSFFYSKFYLFIN